MSTRKKQLVHVYFIQVLLQIYCTKFCLLKNIKGDYKYAVSLGPSTDEDNHHR